MNLDEIQFIVLRASDISLEQCSVRTIILNLMESECAKRRSASVNIGDAQRRREQMMKNKWTITEVKSILECAIGEVESVIPSNVLEQAVAYLTEYENLKAENSWDKFPEAFY